MNKKTIKFSVSAISTLAMMFGCDAVSGNKTAKSKLATTKIMPVQEVKDAVSLTKVAQELQCSRGVFVVDVVKDYVAGPHSGNILQIHGAGVVNKKPDKEFNPYQYLHFVPRDPSKKLSSDNIADVGNALSVEFGNAPVDSAAYEEDVVLDRKSLRAMMGKAPVSGSATAEGAPLTVYFSHKSPTDKTYHISQGAGGAPIARADEEVHAVRGKAEDGVADLKSFNIEINKKFFAMTVPTDMENEEGLNGGVSGAVGKPLIIKINPRPVPPAPVKSNFLTVVVDDRSSAKPKWRSIYRVADKGQSELQIPTKWTGGAMSEGKVGIEMTRSYVSVFPFPDDKGGNICIESGAGVRTTGNLDKEAAPAKK